MDHILDSKAFEQRVCSIVFIFLPHPQLLAIADLFTIPIVLPFPEYCINRIIQYVAFQTGFFTQHNTFEIHLCYYIYQ